MNIVAALKNLRQNGILKTTLKIWPPLVWDRIYEARLGINTSGVYEAEKLGLDPSTSVEYHTLSYYSLHRLMNRFPITESDVFLDLGCGLGRVLIVASGFSFAKILGVELSLQLAQEARRNLEKLEAGSRVQVITANAASYAIPHNVTMVFLNNPFTEPIMSCVLLNIERSLHENPRKLTIIYCNPACYPLFDNCHWLHLSSSITFGEAFEFKCYQTQIA